MIIFAFISTIDYSIVGDSITKFPFLKLNDTANSYEGGIRRYFFLEKNAFFFTDFDYIIPGTTRVTGTSYIFINSTINAISQSKFYAGIGFNGVMMNGTTMMVMSYLGDNNWKIKNYLGGLHQLNNEPIATDAKLTQKYWITNLDSNIYGGYNMVFVFKWSRALTDSLSITDYLTKGKINIKYNMSASIGLLDSNSQPSWHISRASRNFVVTASTIIYQSKYGSNYTSDDSNGFIPKNVSFWGTDENPIISFTDLKSFENFFSIKTNTENSMLMNYTTVEQDSPLKLKSQHKYYSKMEIFYRKIVATTAVLTTNTREDIYPLGAFVSMVFNKAYDIKSLYITIQYDSLNNRFFFANSTYNNTNVDNYFAEFPLNTNYNRLINSYWIELDPSKDWGTYKSLWISTWERHINIEDVKDDYASLPTYENIFDSDPSDNTYSLINATQFQSISYRIMYGSNRYEAKPNYYIENNLSNKDSKHFDILSQSSVDGRFLVGQVDLILIAALVLIIG